MDSSLSKLKGLHFIDGKTESPSEIINGIVSGEERSVEVPKLGCVADSITWGSLKNTDAWAPPMPDLLI